MPRGHAAASLFHQRTNLGALHIGTRGRGNAGRHLLQCFGHGLGNVHIRFAIGLGMHGAHLFGLTGQRLHLLLLLPQLCIGTAAHSQAAMGSLFHDAALFHHYDVVCPSQRRKAVRDNDHGLLDGKALDAGQDVAFAVGVHVGGGLVEQVDGGVAQKGTGNGQALALATGKVGAAFGNGNVQPALLQHEIVQVALAQRAPQGVIGCVAVTHQQVGANGALEDVCRSRYVGYQAAQGFGADVAQLNAVVAHAAGISHQLAGKQLRQGRFARAAFAGDAHKGVLFDPQVYISQGVAFTVRVRKPLANDFHLPGFHRFGPLVQVGQAKQGKHLVEHRGGAHGGVKIRPQDAHRQKELHGQQRHRDGSSKRDLARGQLEQGYHDAHRSTAEGEEVHDGNGVQLHTKKAHSGGAEAFGLFVHLQLLCLVCLEQLQRGKRADGLVERLPQVGIGIPVGAHHAARHFHDGNNGDGDKRHAHQQNHGRRHIDEQEQREQGKGRQHRIEQLRQVLAKVHFQLLCALAADLHRLRGGNLLFIGRAQGYQLVVDPFANGSLAHRRCLRPCVLRYGHEQEAQHHGRRRNRSPLPNRGHIQRIQRQGRQKRGQGKHGHRIADERSPVARNGKHQVLARFGYQLQQSLVEHLVLPLGTCIFRKSWGSANLRATPRLSASRAGSAGNGGGRLSNPERPTPPTRRIRCRFCPASENSKGTPAFRQGRPTNFAVYSKNS